MVEESTASLASGAFFFAIVVTVKRGVGGVRLRGELRFHANILSSGANFPVDTSLQIFFPEMSRTNPTSLLLFL